MRKSFEDLSAPFPVAAPRGRGAGIRPQLPRLILRASTQYFSPRTRPLSMLSAAALKRFAAFLSASSLLPMVSWELKARTEDIGGGLETAVAERLDGVLGWVAGCAFCDDKREASRSLACDISPSEMLASLNCTHIVTEGLTHNSCGKISMRMLNSSSVVIIFVVAPFTESDASSAFSCSSDTNIRSSKGVLFCFSKKSSPRSTKTRRSFSLNALVELCLLGCPALER